MFSDLFLRNHWLSFVLAFVCAIALWYTVNAREQVERVVEVRLDYKGLPPGLVVTSGQLNKISVRLRGPLELLRSLSNRDLSYTLNLSSLTPGSNVIPLYSDAAPVAGLRGYEAVETIPSRLTLEVDRVLEARLPVEARLRDSSLTPSLKLRQVQIHPDTITVRGPAAEVSKLQKMVVEVPVTLTHEDTVVTDDLTVVAPPSMEVTPTTVKVTRLLEVQRKTISLQRDVIVDTGETVNLNLTPSRVTLRISVPSSAFKDAAYLAQIQASLESETLLERIAALAAPGSGEAQSPNAATPGGTVESLQEPVKISLPPGARLISVTPEKVRLTLAK